MTEISQWIAYPEQQQLTIMSKITGVQTTHQCPQCQQPAQCDIRAGKATCWCFELEPRQTVINSSATCVCRQCLSLMPIV